MKTQTSGRNGHCRIKDLGLWWLGLIAVISFPVASHAQNTTWTNLSNVNNSWTNTANWNNGVPNAVVSNAFINKDTVASYSVNFDAPSAGFGTLFLQDLGGGLMTLNVNASALTLSALNGLTVNPGVVLNVNSGGVLNFAGGTVSLHNGVGALNVNGSGVVTNTGVLTIGGGPSDSGIGAVTATNGGTIVTAGLVVGDRNDAFLQFTSTLYVASSSLVTNHGSFTVGGLDASANGTVTIDGGKLVSVGGATAFLGNVGAGSAGTMIVTNGGSFSDDSGMRLGAHSYANTGIMSIGGNSTGTITGTLSWGDNANATGKVFVTSGGVLNVNGGVSAVGAGSFLVDGAGSVVNISGGTVTSGNTSSGNGATLIATNGGSFVTSSNVVLNPGGVAIVTAGGKLVANGITVGLQNGSGTLNVSANGVVTNTGVLAIGGSDSTSGIGAVMATNAGTIITAGLYVGYRNNAFLQFTNTLYVGAGSLVTNNGGLIVGGVNDSANGTVTLDGGRLVSVGGGTAKLGYVGNGSASTIIVTNGGSFSDDSGMIVGGAHPAYHAQGILRISSGGSVVLGGGLTAANTVSSTGQVFVTSGGLLEANSLVIGAGGASAVNFITNSGGIYQFTTNTPTITPNGAGGIALNNGTISHRGIANADVFGNWNGTLTNISFSGNNTFRLNSASNRNDIAQSYVFDTGRGATNYTRLELVNAGTAWRSATLTIGSGGSLLASNASATVAAAFSSTGSVKVTGSTISFLSNSVIAGSYRSDPSTNIFASNLTIAPSGYLAGSNGDLFVFQRDFINQSVSNTAFDLQYASVLFTNGVGPHLFESSAKDNGANFSGIDAVVTNYAIGTLQLAVGDSLLLTGAVANALYVGVLDIGGIAHTNNLTLDINLYYDSGLNPYLGGNTYSLGSGSLIPYPAAIIPEPSMLTLSLVVGALIQLWRRKNRVA